MATYTTDLQVMNAADSATGWAEMSGHTSGGAPSADTENYLQNAISISQATGQASGTAAGLEYDYGSNITWTTGWVFIAWQYYTAPTNIDSWANGGMRIAIGSSSGNVRFWNAMGGDFGGSPYACWQNTAIDPQVTGDGTADGSPTAGAYRIFGSLPNVLAKITKGNPHAVDIIRYGRGEIRATGTGGTFAGFAAANDGATARWGLFQKILGGYLWKGLLSFGQAATSLTFSDSNVNITLDDTPRVAAGFNAIRVLNSGTSVTLSSVNITGRSLSITGSAPVSRGDFNNTDSGTIAWTGCSFTDLGTFVFNTTTNSNTLTDCTWRRCGQITQAGATITGALITNSYAAVALVVDDLSSVTENSFVSTGTGHAVNLGTFASSASVTWNNTDTGYATQIGTAANRTILVNVASGQTLTINVSAGASTPTYYNTGTGTVVVQSSITLTMIVKGGSPPVALEGARAYIDDNDSSPYIMDTTTNSSGIATVGHGDGPVSGSRWRVRKYGYKQFDQTVDIGSVDITLPITMVVDPQQT